MDYQQALEILNNWRRAECLGHTWESIGEMNRNLVRQAEEIVFGECELFTQIYENQENELLAVDF